MKSLEMLSTGLKLWIILVVESEGNRIKRLYGTSANFEYV